VFEGDGLRILRERCDACGRCAVACAAGALEVFGRTVTVEEVMDEVRRDTPFYGSGGGLTVSGGEPFSQPDFTAALLAAAKEEGLTTAVETSGCAPWEAISPALGSLGLVLYDLKHADPDRHREGTGASNELILENLGKLAAGGRARIRLRVPLIPRFNADPNSLAAMARVARDMGMTEVDLLPYHLLGTSKYKSLDREYPWAGVERLTDREIEEMRRPFESAGLGTRIGG
jgi:pyruvate formate lyase activating enzyme